MKNEYLSKCAPISEACEWLQARTGEVWTLARLLENGLMPWFWFDYSPGGPEVVFNGHTQGYLAPMCYAGDVQRLAADGHDVLVTMTRTQGGLHMVLSPALRFPIDELRFRREYLERLAKKMENDKRLVEATAANDRTPLLPVPTLEEVRNHAHANTEARARRIRDILSGIAKTDPEFALDKMPGTKVDFLKLCQALDQRLFSIAPTTFDDYIKGVCKFQQGARASDYYKKLAPQLGVKGGDISKPA